MGVTLTPINGFTLPDDNELLRNVFSHMRNHANQLEAALRSRGLTSSDVTGFLDLLGRVNTLEARPVVDVSKVTTYAEAVPGTNWGLWADTSYARMTWTLAKNGMATVTGAMAGSATLVPAVKVCGLPSAAFAPKVTSQGGAATQIVPAMISETVRLAEIRSDGLYVRGTAPAAGQYIFINATYPTTSVTT
jgi:hypothetical protein